MKKKETDDRSIPRGPREVSASISMKIEGDFIAALFDGFLPYCPLCLFTHPSALWVRCSDKRYPGLRCANCKAVVLRVYRNK